MARDRQVETMIVDVSYNNQEPIRYLYVDEEFYEKFRSFVEKEQLDIAITVVAEDTE